MQYVGTMNHPGPSGIILHVYLGVLVKYIIVVRCSLNCQNTKMEGAWGAGDRLSKEAAAICQTDGNVSPSPAPHTPHAPSIFVSWKLNERKLKCVGWYFFFLYPFFYLFTPIVLFSCGA